MGTSAAKQSEVYVQEGEKKRLTGEGEEKRYVEEHEKIQGWVQIVASAEVVLQDLKLHQEPKDALALSIRGDAKRICDDFAGAIEDLDEALQMEPKNAFALRSRGDAKRMLHDFAGAIADLDSVLELEQKNAGAVRSRGEAKIMLGDFAGAIADFDFALKLEPKNIRALAHRGKTKIFLDNLSGAMADLDLALQLEPQEKNTLLKLQAAFIRAAKTRSSMRLVLAGERLKWAVVGAGPVGLALALSMAASMQEKGLDTTVAGVDVYESRWVEWSEEDAKWRRASFFSNLRQLYFL